MPTAMDVVEVQVEAQLKRRASEILESQGLTLNDAVQQMLTHVAEKGFLQFAGKNDSKLYGEDDPEYDAWFRAKVQEALDDPRPPLSAEHARERMTAFRRTLANRATA